MHFLIIPACMGMQRESWDTIYVMYWIGWVVMCSIRILLCHVTSDSVELSQSIGWMCCVHVPSDL